MDHEVINHLRKKIDEIDNEIINLIDKRMKVVEKIGAYKKKNKLLILDSARWQNVLMSRIEKARERNISEKVIKEIWNLLHKEAIQIEEKVK